MQQKRIIIITIGIIALLFITSIIILLSAASKPSINNTISPTSSQIQITQTQQTGSLRVLQVSPSDKATDIGLDQKITITFNTPVSLQNILFAMSPNTTYDLSLVGNSLIITPRNYLLANTLYSYTLAISRQSPVTFSFTTTPVVITSQDSVPGASDQLNKEKFPDIFVYNRLPFSSSGFSVNGGFTSSPTEHYYFTVSLTTQDGKTGFLNWLKSLGLTDPQIQTLDIRYQ